MTSGDLAQITVRGIPCSPARRSDGDVRYVARSIFDLLIAGSEFHTGKCCHMGYIPTSDVNPARRQGTAAANVSVARCRMFLSLIRFVFECVLSPVDVTFSLTYN